MNSKQLKEKLDKENAEVVRLFKYAVLSDEGLGKEYYEAYNKAKKTWREWCDALDRGE
ncbi:hypothetical protein UFOVP574_16 [uncultured Caudovirales phage]|uniref:Uncharacterized protein n=1 Tax=uncultured Caudovirales phage TaxID=2100421 RepID=A0A6J5N4M2_9CAUD|nr:hypothetical protein UFOVP574_16 [uncultured Caudovirales phage]